MTFRRRVWPTEDSQGNVSLSVPEASPSLATITAALAGIGAGSVDNGAHSYLVTFVTPEGETSFNDEDLGAITATVIDKTANGKITLANVPKGSAFVTKRRIYRTAAGADPNIAKNYKLVGELLDNVNTTYTDGFADAALGAPIPIDNTSQNKILYFEAATGKTWIGGVLIA